MKPCRGFTLLEVMLAFVLLATAMGLLIAMLSRGLHQVREAQSETEATLYAQSLIDQIGVLGPIVPGQSRGEFGDDRYRYLLEISEVPDPASAPAPASADAPVQRPNVAGMPRVYRVALAVSWGTNQRDQRLKLVTLRSRLPALGVQGAQ